MPDAFELDSRPLAFNQDLTGDHSMPVKIKFLDPVSVVHLTT